MTTCGSERGAKGQPLAVYRSSGGADDRLKRAEGEYWRNAVHCCKARWRRLRVSRTSSQDAGVDAGSEVVVATASLEVGYNDPRAGAVIQHRAPHDHATFLQRRGRAGRSLDMRPWMVTVLSEYGRDRNAFQMYEQLMEPTLERLRLPIGNRYVQRIQATHAFLDWLALQLPHRGWSWPLVDGPKPPQSRDGAKEVLALLDRLLSGEQASIGALRAHVKGAIQLSDDDADAVMWMPPRSLMLEVSSRPCVAGSRPTGWLPRTCWIWHSPGTRCRTICHRLCSATSASQRSRSTYRMSRKSMPGRCSRLDRCFANSRQAGSLVGLPFGTRARGTRSEAN